MDRIQFLYICVLSMTVACTVCEIGNYCSENANSNPSQPYLILTAAPTQWGLILFEFWQSFGILEFPEEGRGECDGQTDRQTFR